MSAKPSGARTGLSADFGPVVVVAVGILVAAVMPVPDTPGAPSWTGVAVHVTLYAALATVLVRAWERRRWPRPWLGPVVAATAYGGVHELVQAALPWRSATGGDLMADAAGALLAVALLRARRSVTDDRARRPRQEHHATRTR